MKTETKTKIITAIESVEKPENMPIHAGNSKLGKDTGIFNMQTAFNCTSHKLGLCPLRNICYALKAEKQYHHNVPGYRHKQALYWDSEDAETISNDIKGWINRRRTETPYVRFNEAGDIPTMDDLKKLCDIARENPKQTFYGYTHRTDLMSRLEEVNKPKNLIINGSDFMVDNAFIAYEKEYETMISINKHKLGLNVCGGSCAGCDYCKTKGNKTILVKKH